MFLCKFFENLLYRIKGSKNVIPYSVFNNHSPTIVLGVGESNQVWWTPAIAAQMMNAVSNNFAALPGHTNMQILQELHSKNDNDWDNISPDKTWKIIVVINTGINDAESKTSETEYIWSLNKIYRKVQRKLREFGYTNFEFVFLTAHPLSCGFSEWRLREYRELTHVFRSTGVGTVINLSQVTSPGELRVNGWYDDVTENHLSEKGYLAIAKKIV